MKLSKRLQSVKNRATLAAQDKSKGEPGKLKHSNQRSSCDMEKEKTKKNTEEVEEAADLIPNRKSNGNSSKGSNSASGGEDSEDKSSIFSLSHIKLNCRNTVSKYDFVKVKVWLGDNADHYYVFSRFLLSRMLTVTKIPNHVAIKIALELKKLLVDNSLLDVSQSDLEANLFKLMERRGYGEEYISRYRMMTSAPLSSSPVWARNFSSSEELVTEFVRECRIVRKGLAGDLKKAMKDGKPIIIEGIHLDPSIYLMDDDSKAPATTTEKTNSESVPSDDNPVTQVESNSASVCVSDWENGNNSPEQPGTGGKISSEQVNKIADSLESIALAGTSSENKGETPKDPGVDRNTSVKKEKSGPDPIIIPIVLKMADFDHKALLEEWILTHTFGDKCLVQNKDELVSKLKTIQNYLCSFKSQGVTVVNVSATTFPQTLDWLHGYLLQCIEKGMKPTASNLEFYTERAMTWVKQRNFDVTKQNGKQVLERACWRLLYHVNMYSINGELFVSRRIDSSQLPFHPTRLMGQIMDFGQKMTA
ncbi:P-loop containing nucleoside triphosphate hydrolases superfamily protein [Citrus sinensis]|nr:P-loop containing nucleoside triphosphate hydrolases superfamily protein [Citrus sinensis]